MKDINKINNVNLRHLARMSNAIEYYTSKKLTLAELIGELVFLRDSIEGLEEDVFCNLNNGLVDLESLSSAAIEGVDIKPFLHIEKEALDLCKAWIEEAENLLSK